jgi:hypothetical protein
MTTNLATKIADLLFLEDSTVKNLVRKESQADIRKDVTAFLNGYERALRNHQRNTSPSVPVGDAAQRPYPDREAVKPDYVDVPSPDATETSIPSKKSDKGEQYGDTPGEAMERLQQSLDDLTENGNVESMEAAIAALDDLREWLKTKE